MGVSTIDCTLEEVHLKTARRNVRVYKQLKFRLTDGRERTVVKAIVDAEVAEALLPGTSGRFYLFQQIDHGDPRNQPFRVEQVVRGDCCRHRCQQIVGGAKKR